MNVPEYEWRPDVGFYRRVKQPRRPWLRVVVVVLIALCIGAILSARTLTFGNGDDFAVVVKVNGPDGQESWYPVPGFETRTFAITDDATSVSLINAASGTSMTGTVSLASGSAVLTDYGALNVYQVSEAAGGSSSPVDGLSGADALAIFAKGFFLMVGFEFFGLILRVVRQSAPGGTDV